MSTDGPRRTLSAVLAARGIPPSMATEFAEELESRVLAHLDTAQAMGQISLADHQAKQLARAIALDMRSALAEFVLRVNQRAQIEHAPESVFGGDTPAPVRT